MTAKCIETAGGVVEIETQGSGLPVVVLHGSPGGIDGARAMSQFLLHDSFKVICLSRPGYLGTPLDAKNASIDREADLLAAVLDTLEISRAGVLAWSGGGPAAYRFAVRHPSRVSALVAIAAVSSCWTTRRPTMLERFLFGTSVGERIVALMTRAAPEHVVEGALENEGSLRRDEVGLLTKQVMADAEQRRLVLDIVLTVNTGGKRQAGWQNDVRNFARITSLELERVQCPVLLIHGDADTDASIEHSRAAHARLPHSSLVVMDRGTHLAFYAHPEATKVQASARRWLSEPIAKADGPERL